MSPRALRRQIGRLLIGSFPGPALSPELRSLAREFDLGGVIYFARNVESPEQVAELSREAQELARELPLWVSVDQEGGRVARLPSPPWRKAPFAGVFGQIAETDAALGARAARLNALLIGAELRALGINVDCAPVLDLRVSGAHDIIGDRAFSDDPGVAARLGRAACEGFLDAGVVPVIKHIPGHGRARADSHESLPVVDTPLDALRQSDFAPFRSLSDMPMAMTAHIVYSAADAARPATTSPAVIGTIIRGELGFDGLLMSDDICMKALAGSLAERTKAVLAAGCDVVLHCNGDLAEMETVAAAAAPLSESAARRLGNALDRVSGGASLDVKTAQRDLDGILKKLAA